MSNELENFLNDVTPDENQEADILNQSLTPEEEVKPEQEPDEDSDELSPKNRRERRLLRKLEAERNASIALAAKLEALSEARALTTSEESDYLKAVERIYGTDTPEAQMATDLLKKAIVGARDEAERRAIERFEQSRLQEQEGVRKAEAELENIVDELEDTYNFEFTDAQEKAYFTLLQKMSPKDSDGNIINLADPHAVWEIFSERLNRKNSDNRTKDLASRSMVQGSQTVNTNVADEAAQRQLRELGII